MFQTQAVMSASIATPRSFGAAPRCAFFAAEPGILARRLLPILAAGALIAVAAGLSRGGVELAPAFGRSLIVSDASVIAVRGKAEAMRADMRHLPGVAAVTIAGLVQQGLSVEYTPRRLATFGLTPDTLAAALPVDTLQSRPGHLVLRTSAAGDLQSVANTPLHAQGRVFRLGDVAMVMRTPLAAPVSTMAIGGQPAARLDVVLAR